MLKTGGTIMEISEMTLQYYGFHPSDYTREYLEKMMEEIYNESPHGSYFQAAFSRQNHTFRARVRIDSGSGGHFFAVASGRKLKDVTHRVVTQIRKQLGKWKASRFAKGQPRKFAYEFNNELQRTETESRFETQTAS